jgi:CheY-like chemotaxis protein
MELGIKVALAPQKDRFPMATDRRRFLTLLALGVPATTSAMTQDWDSTIHDSMSKRDGSPVMWVDLVSGLSERFGDLMIRDNVSFQVIRHAPSDCPPGKIRWAIEIEEPDGSSNFIADRHPKVLVVCDKSLEVLYSTCLEQAGCRVEAATDNNAAMRLYRGHGPYDLVLAHHFNFRGLSKRIRERNPEQAIAIVGCCSATTFRFREKVPVLREDSRQRQFVRLVESAIKPRMRILMVIAEPEADREQKLVGPKIEGYCQVWSLVTSIPETFEIELETDGNEALKRYRERGPYDMVLSELLLPGLAGPDLAAAIRSENPGQRIVMITDSASIESDILRDLADIPVVNLRKQRTIAAMKRARTKRRYEDGEAQALLAWVEAGIRPQMTRKRAKQPPKA